MTHKTRALELVRAACPELMELSLGCEVNVGDKTYILDSDITVEKCEGEIRKADNYHVLKNNYNDLRVDLTTTPWGVIGHPPQLQHWLRLLEEKTEGNYMLSGKGWVVANGVEINFNLTTGQPATDSDFAAIVSIIEGDA